MAQAIVMVSMELTDDEITDMMGCMPYSMKDAPRFPYGLRISITDKELAKLKMDHPDGECIGGMIHGHFMGRITGASMNETQDGMRSSLEIQIEDLAVECEDMENAEASPED